MDFLNNLLPDNVSLIIYIISLIAVDGVGALIANSKLPANSITGAIISVGKFLIENLPNIKKK
jgi:hypothetical protein